MVQIGFVNISWTFSWPRKPFLRKFLWGTVAFCAVVGACGAPGGAWGGGGGGGGGALPMPHARSTHTRPRPLPHHLFRRRPYRVECTGSLLTSEVKRHRAWLVLGWGTAWEHPQVLSAFSISSLASAAHQAPPPTPTSTLPFSCNFSE